MSSISAYAKARLLDGTLEPDQASLHSAFPGTTGANELSAGGYARQAIVFGASSGGVRLLSAPVSFTVASETVRWIGYWQAGNWLFASPAGGATPKNFMARPANDTVYAASHGWSDDQPVVLFNGTPPGGITEGTIYYVRDSDTDTFKLAATVGGAAIDLTTAPSFGCVIAAITERVFSGTGTFDVDSSSIVVPD